MGAIRIGCSGWVYRDWRGVLYPPGLPQRSWLARYAEVFDTVEVNSTFYRLARPGAADGWLAATPPGFLFTCKGSRYLTHMKRLRDMADGLERFYGALAPLPASDRWGPVLWQLPERDRLDLPRLAAALDTLAATGPAARHAFEFRHPSWFTDDVLELLRRHGAALVIGDHPERPWQPHELTAPFTLVRLHFGARGRRGNYARPELEAWADELRRLAEGADVLAYFNNDWEGFAVRNARALKRLLAPTPLRAARRSPG
ncbi:MAG: hypothetical protein JWO90_470 [Solirubrobacterales bacterium]|nr:hypothetical protein [Solirubrobacterales bacterium]